MWWDIRHRAVFHVKSHWCCAAIQYMTSPYCPNSGHCVPSFLFCAIIVSLSPEFSAPEKRTSGAVTERSSSAWPGRLRPVGSWRRRRGHVQLWASVSCSPAAGWWACTAVQASSYWSAQPSPNSAVSEPSQSADRDTEILAYIKHSHNILLMLSPVFWSFLFLHFYFFSALTLSIILVCIA